MKGIYTSIMMGLILTSACKNRQGYQEVKDKDMVVQINRMANPTGYDSTINYKVRIRPDRSQSKKISGKQKVDLMYRMDSCFYIKTKESIIYASLTQPIANGVAGTFEYLLEFELSRDQQRSAIAFIYQDRYINRKVYNISFDQNKP